MKSLKELMHIAAKLLEASTRREPLIGAMIDNKVEYALALDESGKLVTSDYMKNLHKLMREARANGEKL
jgi:hypothetical protein